jgi:hypothetical protein
VTKPAELPVKRPTKFELVINPELRQQRLRVYSQNSEADRPDNPAQRGGKGR